MDKNSFVLHKSTHNEDTNSKTRENFMENCKNCRQSLDNGIALRCPNCGATMCKHCATETKNICPYCYSTLDYYI